MHGSASSAKLAVITGVSRGLGRAMARGLAEAGWTIAGCGRTADAIATLQEALPRPHYFAQVDVTSDDHVARFAADVLKSVGTPDLLINNAAVINPNAPLWEVSAEEFARVTDVNINGVANVIRRFVPAMIERGSGIIVNFSSGWGRSTSPEVAPYCASKWAIEGLTAALASELPDGMAAIPLNPGVINTEMLQSCFGHGAANFPTADEWAVDAVELLLSLTPADNGRPMSVM